MTFSGVYQEQTQFTACVDLGMLRKRSVDMEQKSKDFIRQSLTRIGELAAHPAAFGVLLAYALLWFIFDRTTLDWHGFATLAAVFMTLIIQRAEAATSACHDPHQP